MNEPDLHFELVKLAQERLGDRAGQFRIPPPSFELMQGQIVEFDRQAGSLSVRFPILESYLNPYHAMQGGLIAAAVDNVLGPLSMLVAPPNYTRRMELTFSRPVSLEMGTILVVGRLVEQNGQQLHFRADVLDSKGSRLARASALHWIIQEIKDKPDVLSGRNS